jgi:hypothetical protein
MAYRIQSRVGVQAPAFAVWDVLSDLEGWKDWNPLFTEAEGRLSIGSLLQLRRVRPDGVGELHEVRVLDWVPNEQILWTYSAAPFAKVIGFLEIEALSATGCVLSVGELYTGFVGDWLGQKNRKKLTPGWRKLAEALKDKAEATWDGTPGEAPPPPEPKAKEKKKPVQMQQMSILGRRKMTN